MHVHALERPAGLAGARERAAATSAGRALGVDAGVDDRQMAARRLLARADHEIDARVGRERPRGALVAVEDLQDVAQVEQLGHPLGGQRRLLGRLEHDGVAGTSAAASAPQVAASGSLHGIRIATTPRGSRSTRSPRGGRARSSGPSSA